MTEDKEKELKDTQLAEDSVKTAEGESGGEQNKKRLGRPPLIVTVLVVLMVALLIVDQLLYVSFMIKPRWIITRTDSGMELMHNPELMEIRTQEIESELAQLVAPEEGAVIPVEWGDIGKKMIDLGVIDKEKFYTLHEKRGGFGEYERSLLEKEDNGHIMINAENSNTMLNIFWALGLANKNRILEEGPMVDKKYGGDASRFAATGGWTLSTGNTMNHYSKHSFMTLTEEQQNLVEEVTKNIYRPCCGNSTHFPDCNHGMAMLGLMELMASQGATEQEMYNTALSVNSFWFSDNYMTIGKYFAKRGVEWSDIDAKEVLGAMYSSARGYAQIAREVEPVQSGGGGSCGV